MPPDEEIDRLRAEVDAWRRRAELAERVAAKRLARAETAEAALRAAEAALRDKAGPDEKTPGDPRSRGSLLERWRRYTESLD